MPLYILGSSLFGARLAARLGLPYGFASHFAPGALERAVEIYRREFRPSAQLDAPHVIAGLNVVAADTTAEAKEHFASVQRMRVKLLIGKNLDLTDDEAQQVLDSPAGAQIKAMATYSAVGTASEVAAYVEKFTALSKADELIVVHPAPTLEARLRSLELLRAA